LLSLCHKFRYIPSEIAKATNYLIIIGGKQMEKSFGKFIIIKENVQYIGDGEDPAKDPAFNCWANALARAVIELKMEISQNEKVS